MRYGTPVVDNVLLVDIKRDNRLYKENIILLFNKKNNERRR